MSDCQRDQRKCWVRILTFAISIAGLLQLSGSATASEIILDGSRFAQAQPAQPENPKPPSPTAVAPPPAASPQPPPAKSEGTPAVVMNSQEVESILGKKVRSEAGDDMGRIVDIIADKAGHLRAAIIDFGGFLGVGSKQIAVDWKAIRFTGEKGKSEAAVVNLTRDQLRVAPVYKSGEQIVILGQPSNKDQATSAPSPEAGAANPAAKDSQSK